MRIAASRQLGGNVRAVVLACSTNAGSSPCISSRDPGREERRSLKLGAMSLGAFPPALALWPFDPQRGRAFGGAANELDRLGPLHRRELRGVHIHAVGGADQRSDRAV